MRAHRHDLRPHEHDDQGAETMFSRWRASGAAALAIGAFAGCGGGQPRAALKDPGVQGVDALRQAMRTALLNHDEQHQCELFAPSLIEAHGNSIKTCAAWLK